MDVLLFVHRKKMTFPSPFTSFTPSDQGNTPLFPISLSILSVSLLHSLWHHVPSYFARKGEELRILKKPDLYYLSNAFHFFYPYQKIQFQTIFEVIWFPKNTNRMKTNFLEKLIINFIHQTKIEIWISWRKNKGTFSILRLNRKHILQRGGKDHFFKF